MSWLHRKFNEESGAAVASAMLVLLLMAGITAGLTALVITDTRVRAMDGTRTQAFYAAHAGLEKLTADLGDLFAVNFAPNGALINAVANNPPALGVTWQMPDGTDGYLTTFPADGAGNPVASTTTVMSGPFQGLVGLATPYQMSVTARLPDGSEASLTRTLQTVAIPVFQFGMFSENDLSFFAGPIFNFGGRVHTNSNLFLASGATVTMQDRVTTVGEVVRTHLSNGWDTNVNYNGNVSILTSPGLFRDLLKTEGSVLTTLGSALNEPAWTNLSTGDYNHYLMNGRTGARRLDLPVVSFGATPIDLIRRPPANENVNNPNVLSQRFFTLASLRIFLSDTAANITGMPGVTPAAPVPLGGPAGVSGAGGTGGAPWALDATHFPFATSPGNLGGALGTPSYGVRTPATTSLLGGFIKIEMQNAANVWIDVTAEILNLGVSGKQIDVAGCAEISPNAVIRIQHLRDGLNGGACITLPYNAAEQAFLWTGAGAASSLYNYSPNVLFDTREGEGRDATADAESVHLGGVMHYIELDANNLRRWLTGAIGVSGNQALNVNGYTVYFSDRRGNRNAGVETGEYGFEDLVNPASPVGTPNAVLDVGEDFNGNLLLETYGQTARQPYATPGGAQVAWAAMAAPYTALTAPWTPVGNALARTLQTAIAQRNPAVLFRRALKIVNGSLGNIVAPGLTVASENPVYLQGNWNANAAGFGNPHVATAILADAVTLLSNSWSDLNSFANPYDLTAAPAPGRTAATTWYRVAVIAGKGRSFPQPAGAVQDYGTDGGAHNFLRYLENWAGQVLNYRGSIASLYFSRQLTGTYKCCTDVYSPPTRGYNFDVEFLTPALLPPRTPMFRDVNVTGFAQLIRPR